MKAIAAIAAIAAIVAIIATKGPSYLAPPERQFGFLIELTKPVTDCGPDDVWIRVATLHKNRMVQINRDPPLKMAAIPPRLREIFRTSDAKVLVVRADPGVSYRDFVGLIDIARPEVNKIVWFTPAFEREQHQRSCFGS